VGDVAWTFELGDGGLVARNVGLCCDGQKVAVSIGRFWTGYLDHRRSLEVSAMLENHAVWC
jgi:hypothetical protein